MSSPFVVSLVAVVNESTVVNDVDGKNMTLGLNSLLPVFCRDWNLPNANAVYVAKGGVVPPNACKVVLLDTTDVAGTVSYHGVVGSVPVVKVFAKTILDNGGVVLFENTRLKQTVAQVVSHEVFEMLVDPRCLLWWVNPNTTVVYAGEVSDPVDANVVSVRLADKTQVGLSDWVLPSWNDVNNTTGPFNHNDTLTAAFQVDSHGYAMVLSAGKVNYVYGANVVQTSKNYLALSYRTLARVASTGGP
jgi:hypothetical protein